MTNKEIKIEIETSNFFNHMKAAQEFMMKSWKSLLPDRFWEHRRNARREVLLALQSVIDSAIQHLDDTELQSAKAEKSVKAKRKIEIKLEKDRETE